MTVVGEDWLLIGEAHARPPTTERVPINVHPDTASELRTLLMEPEMRAVGYSEFLQRCVALAREELEEHRARIVSSGGPGSIGVAVDPAGEPFPPPRFFVHKDGW